MLLVMYARYSITIYHKISSKMYLYHYTNATDDIARLLRNETS